MVRIESLLPNPVGKDSGAEWIRILGEGTSTNDLRGWRLEDSSGNAFYLDGLGKIGSNERFELRETGISLNNDGDTISLYDQGGVQVDRLEYSGSIAEGEIVLGATIPPNAPPADQTTLADVSRVGALREGLLGGDIIQPLLLGMTIAALATIGFACLWKATLKSNGKNQDF